MNFVNLVSDQFCHDLFYIILFVSLLFAIVSITPTQIGTKVISVPSQYVLLLIVPIIVFCLAGQPINYTGWENDRGNYALSIINNAHLSHPDFSRGDKLFAIYQFFSSKIMNYVGWFYLTATIYVMNYYVAARRLSGEYAFVLFLMMLCTFQFVGYGSNTIRAGFAASFIMLGISFYQKTWLMLIILALASQIHSSMLLPVFMLLLSLRIKNNKFFLYGWLLSFVLSFTMGHYFEILFQGFVEDRRRSYFNSAGTEGYKVGFRWDFLIYSTLPIILGYYYIYKLKLRSAFYQFIWRAYLGTNAIWVLVIRANFTDRFAYLSWFMFPILLFYPLLNQQLYRNVNEHYQKLLWLMVGQGVYTIGFYLLKG